MPYSCEFKAKVWKSIDWKDCVLEKTLGPIANTYPRRTSSAYFLKRRKQKDSWHENAVEVGWQGLKKDKAASHGWLALRNTLALF